MLISMFPPPSTQLASLGDPLFIFVVVTFPMIVDLLPVMVTIAPMQQSYRIVVLALFIIPITSASYAIGLQAVVSLATQITLI